MRGWFRGDFACRNRALFSFGVGTGFRAHEIAQVTRGDLLDNGGYFKRQITVARTKCGGSRTVVLSDMVIDDLLPWLAEMEDKYFMWLSTSNVFCRADGKPMSPGAICKVIGRVCREHMGQLSGKRYGSHSMRKTFAEQMYKYYIKSCAGHPDPLQPMRLLQAALGHANMDNTQRYIRFTTADWTDGVLRAFPGKRRYTRPERRMYKPTRRRRHDGDEKRAVGASSEQVYRKEGHNCVGVF